MPLAFLSTNRKRTATDMIKMHTLFKFRKNSGLDMASLCRHCQHPHCRLPPCEIESYASSRLKNPIFSGWLQDSQSSGELTVWCRAGLKATGLEENTTYQTPSNTIPQCHELRNTTLASNYQTRSGCYQDAIKTVPYV